MSKVVTFYSGSLPHFCQHLAPIYKALPESARGPFHARGRALVEAQRLDIPNLVGGLPRRAELVCCASYEDYRAVKPSPVILVNHGVGQTYRGSPESADHPSYSGGRDRGRVALNLCPSERDAEVCRAGGGVAAAVGVPRLDRFHDGKPHHGLYGKPIVAFSFHTDAHVCAETRWAMPHYRQALIDLAHDQANLPFTMLGHFHPRMHAMMSKFWTQLKVRWTADFDEVLSQSDCYVIDNSSTLYEFASTGRPCLTLNAPWYRRDIEHGLRFWNAIPGHSIDGPEELMGGVLLALADPFYLAEKRRAAVQVAYSGLVDGQATERAVTAIMEYLNA